MEVEKAYAQTREPSTAPAYKTERNPGRFSVSKKGTQDG